MIPTIISQQRTKGKQKMRLQFGIKCNIKKIRNSFYLHNENAKRSINIRPCTETRG